MENSSKALLITAAVLIVVILIALGLRIFTTADVQKGVEVGTSLGDAAKMAASKAKDKMSESQLQGAGGYQYSSSDTTSGETPGGSTGDSTETGTFDGGTISGTSNEIGQVISSSNYGDYIDLGQAVDGIGSSASTDDWRILYNDKSGHVYAILANFLPNTNPAVAASGLKSWKINAPNNFIATYSAFSSDTRQDLINSLNNKEAWKSLISTSIQNKGATVTGSTTLNMIISSYNEKYGTNLNKDINFYIDNDSSKGEDSLYVIQIENIIFNYWEISDKITEEYLGGIMNGPYTGFYEESKR